MTDTATIPTTERLSLKEGSLKAKKIGKLPPEQRRWSDNVLRVLKLPSKGSQGRILAGAISTTEQMRQDNSPDLERAEQLCKVVIDAGTPPWKDTKKAMAAGSAKVELDLLSLPPDECELEPLDGSDGNVNSAYWINRKDPDGVTRRSFLCKPASKKSDVLGVPNGGEVVREALAGRVAQLLAKQTGVDIDMPETHVVSVGSDKLPEDSRSPDGGPLTCSVQEARSNSGALKKLNSLAMASIDAEQIAGLAIFDTITLNTDRHAGNVLIGDQGNLIPIDHGGSMPNPVGLIDPDNPDGGTEDTGIERIGNTLGGPHNALLRLPNAHAPMSAKTLKRLKGLDPDAMAKEMAKDRDEIAAEHPSMTGLVSDAAIECSRRSAMFMKMAASNKPPLSPAAVQVALGSNAKELLDPEVDDKEFRKRAKVILTRTARNKDTIKQVCTASDGEYAELCAQVQALGWKVDGRNDAPTGGIVDPLILTTIIGRTPPIKFVQPVLEDLMQLQVGSEERRAAIRRNKAAQERAAEDNARLLAEMRANPIDPKGADAAMLKVKKAAVAKYIPLLPDSMKAASTNQVRTIMSRPAADQLHDFSRLLDSVTMNVRNHLQTRLAAAENGDQIVDPIDVRFANGYLDNGNFTAAADGISEIEEKIKKGSYPKRT